MKNVLLRKGTSKYLISVVVRVNYVLFVSYFVSVLRKREKHLRVYFPLFS